MHLHYALLSSSHYASKTNITYLSLFSLTQPIPVSLLFLIVNIQKLSFKSKTIGTLSKVRIFGTLSKVRIIGILSKLKIFGTLSKLKIFRTLSKLFGILSKIKAFGTLSKTKVFGTLSKKKDHRAKLNGKIFRTAKSILRIRQIVKRTSMSI